MKTCIFILSFLLGQAAYAQNQLIFAIDVVRHGDRTPIEDIRTPPYHWPEGPGQLTPIGMQQEYQLGQKLGQLYINQYHLLPENYKDNTIYVYATDYDRTLMSAKWLLQGLYPKSVIPIHTDTFLFTPLLNPDRTHFLSQTTFSGSAWQAKKALAPNLAAWSQATGININNQRTLILAGDAVYVRQIHHVPTNLNAKAASNLITAGFTTLAQRYHPHKIGHDTAHHLLMQMDQYLLLASQNKTTLKYVLFSAHDVNILGLMSDLNAPLSGQVPYAADLKLMLFKTPSNHYEVQITYNDTPVKIPQCNSNTCTLQQFIAIDN